MRFRVIADLVAMAPSHRAQAITNRADGGRMTVPNPRYIIPIDFNLLHTILARARAAHKYGTY